MRSSPFLFAVCLGATTATAWLLGACSDETGSGTQSTSTTTTSSSSGDATTGSTSGSPSGSGGSMSGSGGGASSSTSGGTGGSSGEYTDCGSCTDLNAGAPSKECKTQSDSCNNNAACKEIFDCAYMCSTDMAGGCCVKKCFEGKAQAAVDMFRGYDNCVYCTTCKTLCSQPGDAVDATAYCKVFDPGGDANCPP